MLKQAPGPQDGNSAVTETISLAALSLSLSLSHRNASAYLRWIYTSLQPHYRRHFLSQHSRLRQHQVLVPVDCALPSFPTPATGHPWHHHCYESGFLRPICKQNIPFTSHWLSLRYIVHWISSQTKVVLAAVFESAAGIRYTPLTIISLYTV